MQVIHTIDQLRQWRKTAGRVALVPTMGHLHDGHLSLVREARKNAEAVVVSIFVNPLQFGQNEDYDQYPRTLEADSAKLQQEGVDVVFAPSEAELYPCGQQRYQILPPELKSDLCGRSRPKHFAGVATIVTKLFNIVQPDVACFGKKDYQQLAIIRGLVADLNFDIEVIPVKISRSENGLALSSRNAYLSAAQLAQAPQLHACLQKMVSLIEAGNRHYAILVEDAVTYLNSSGWDVDYIEVRCAGTLAPVQTDSNEIVILAAARLGSTRLIDNIEMQVSSV